MSQVVLSSVETTMKGMTVVLLGQVISVFLAFVTRLLIARNIPVDEFGTYTLVTSVASALAVLASLGIPDGIARFISTYRGEGNRSTADAAATVSLKISALSGVLAGACLALFASFTASTIFHEPRLATPLIIGALFVPFAVVISTLSGALRGYGLVLPKVYFQDIGHPLLFIALICGAVVFGGSMDAFLWAFSLSTGVVLVGLLLYSERRIALSMTLKEPGQRHARNLLRFSFPLLAAGVWGMVLTWTDTFMLGRYTGMESVGLYNAGATLARFLTFPLAALEFVFLSVAAEMSVREQAAELRRTYQILTKWTFAGVLPFFLVLFASSEAIIAFLFGSSFTPAMTPLRILAVGSLISVFFGANGTMMIVKGMMREILFCAAAGALLNIILNYVLIARYGLGMTGAATATTVSLAASNAIASWLLYSRYGLHPFTKRYLVPAVWSIVASAVIILIARNTAPAVYVAPATTAAMVAVVLLAFGMSERLDSESRTIFQMIFRKIGIPEEWIKYILH